MIDFLFFIFNFVVGVFTYNDLGVSTAGINPFVGSALVGGAASLLGSALGFGANSSANRSNVKLARETNALNYKMFQEQNQYNTDMWQMNNEYNSPENQVKRALLAGINPYFDAGNLVSASSSNAPTSTSLPSLSVPQVHPYDPVPSFSQVADIASNLMLKQAQIHNLDQKTQESKDLTIARVQNYIAQNEDLKHSARMKRFTADLQHKAFDYDYQMRMYNANISREQWLQNMAQTKIANVNVKMAQLHLEQFPQELRNNLIKQVSDILLTKAQTHASYKQAAFAAAQTIESQARAEGYRISNEQAHQLVPYIVDQAAYDSYMKRAKYSVYTHFGTEDIGRKTHKTFHGSLGISKHFGGMAEWNENYDDWMSLPDNWFDGSASK